MIKTVITQLYIAFCLICFFACEKQKEEFQKKLEADKKAREDAANARKQKIEQKKQLFNQLISE